MLSSLPVAVPEGFNQRRDWKKRVRVKMLIIPNPSWTVMGRVFLGSHFPVRLISACPYQKLHRQGGALYLEACKNVTRLCVSR
jgi:hypothetical protein